MTRLGFCGLFAFAALTVAACSVTDEPFGVGPGGSGGLGSATSSANGTGMGGMPGACAPPAPYPDPTAPGPFEVGTTSYSAGQITLGQSPFQMTVGLRATVYYPAMSAGTDVPVAGTEPYPVVVVLHGNHAIYRKADGTGVDCTETLSPGPNIHLKTLAEIQSQYPGAQTIPNHLGYAYLGSHLASAGYVVVSIDGNDANCINLDGRGFVPERAEVIRKHVEILRSAAASPDLHLLLLAGHIDMSRIVYLGHSRGAEAAIEASRAPSAAGTTVRAVVAIAPSNYLFDGMGRAISARAFVILPAADGDVSFNGGMRYYDVTTPGPFTDTTWFKAQAYVYGANHNFFNSQWNEPLQVCGTTKPGGDNGQGNGSNRISRAQQEHYAIAAVQTFLDAAIDDNAAARSVLAGHAPVIGLENVTVWHSFAEAAAVVPLADAPAATGFTLFGKYDFFPPAAYNASFFHATNGYIGIWEPGAGPAFELPAPAGVGTLRYVALRVAQVVDSQNPPGQGAAIDVELVDGAGNAVRAGSDWAQTLIPSWYERPPWPDPSNNCAPTPVEKTVLGTVRIPAACFQGTGGFLFDNIQTLRVIVRSDSGALAFTDFQLDEQ